MKGTGWSSTGNALWIYLKKSSARVESEVESAMQTLFNKLRIEPPEIRFPAWSEQAAGEKQRAHPLRHEGRAGDMKILLTGASGFVGRVVREAIPG